jgi:hypothetical protein
MIFVNYSPNTEKCRKHFSKNILRLNKRSIIMKLLIEKKVYNKSVWEKYNLALQTITVSLDSSPNYQNLYSGFQPFKTFKKGSILMKYPHNTPITCHFSIKKIKK